MYVDLDLSTHCGRRLFSRAEQWLIDVCLVSCRDEV